MTNILTIGGLMFQLRGSIYGLVDWMARLVWLIMALAMAMIGDCFCVFAGWLLGGYPSVILPYFGLFVAL